MARRKIHLADGIARVVYIETEATKGATLGTNLYLPSGVLATPTNLAAYLGLSGSSGGSSATQHSQLQGLSGNDHPQYALAASLASVAFSGAYSALSGKPTIPSNIDDLADVNVYGVADGDVLTFDVGTGTWIAAAPAAGGGGSSDTEGQYFGPSSWRIEDDFLKIPSTSVPMSSEWSPFVSSGDISQAGSSTTPGVIRFSTLNSSSSQSNAIYGSPNAAGSYTPIVVGGGEIVFECRARVSANANGTDNYYARLGLMDELSGSPGNGIYFSNGSSGEFQYVTRDGTLTGLTDASLTWGTGWRWLKLVVNAAGTSVDFYVDGVLRQTNTTNIPTAGMSLGLGIQKAAGTTSRWLDVDYVRCYQTLTTARW